jgi:hypothetical protein
MNTTVDEAEVAEITKRNHEQSDADSTELLTSCNCQQNGSVSREQLQSWWKKLHGTDYCVLP